jgi:hypothetical protein
MDGVIVPRLQPRKEIKVTDQLHAPTAQLQKSARCSLAKRLSGPNDALDAKAKRSISAPAGNGTPSRSLHYRGWGNPAVGGGGEQPEVAIVVAKITWHMVIKRDEYVRFEY